MPPRIADGQAELAVDVGGADRVRESWPGRPFPLGATWDGGGTNFSLFSEHAEWIELCLFDEDGEETPRRDDPAPRATTGTATCPA